MTISSAAIAFRAAMASSAPGTLQNLGVRAPPGSPAQWQTRLASPVCHWGEVIRAAKIEPE